MKLWLLYPQTAYRGEKFLWEPWYDKSFGFVIRAETEEDARRIAQENGGDEIYENMPAWIDPHYSVCEELLAEGDPGLILQDFASA